MIHARSVRISDAFCETRGLLFSKAVQCIPPIYTAFWERQSYGADKIQEIGIHICTPFLGGSQTTASPSPDLIIRHTLCQAAATPCVPSPSFFLSSVQICIIPWPGLARVLQTFSLLKSCCQRTRTSAPNLSRERADKVLRLSVRWQSTLFQDFLHPSTAAVATL